MKEKRRCFDKEMRKGDREKKQWRIKRKNKIHQQKQKRAVEAIDLRNVSKSFAPRFEEKQIESR